MTDDASAAGAQMSGIERKPASTARAEPQTTAEFDRLRQRVVAQAAELAALRWQLSSMADRGPGQRRLAFLMHRLAQRFPAVAKRLMPFVRAARQRLAVSSREESQAAPTSQLVALADRLRVSAPVLVVGDAVAARLGAAARDAATVVGADSGFCLPTRADADQVTLLRRADKGSLANWLAADPTALRRMKCVIVDARDHVSLSLLHGRMMPEQTLVLTDRAQADHELVATLGPASETDEPFSSFARLPEDWLDPLDAGCQLAASVDHQAVWPKISVIMVSFNQATFLEEGLRSVLDQGYPDLEFIVVDGQSTDGSIEILERYRSRLSHLTIEKDQGQSDGLNKGFALATGEILTWVNSDDLLEPGALFRVAQAFRQYKVDMVAGGCRQIGLTRSKVLHNHHTKLPFGRPVSLPLGLLLELDGAWLTGSFFFQPEVFFTRDIWLRAGGRLRVDLYYVLDYDLWVRMAAAGASIVHIPDFLACSRTHDQQKTTVGLPFMPEVQRLLREYGRRLTER